MWSMDEKKKIEIKKIDDATKRRVTFSNRCSRLIKKAHELSVLCDVEVGVIVFSSTNRLYQFSSSSMRGMIDRLATDPSTSQMQDEMRQELELLRNEFTKLKAENERLMGNNLGGLSVEQLQQLDQQMSDAMTSIRERKDAMLFEEMERSNRKERELDHENDALRGEMVAEKLKRFISAGPSKHNRVSPETEE